MVATNQIIVSDQTGYSIYIDWQTGVAAGGVLSINGSNPAKFDISAGYGYVVDRFSDPIHPTYKKVEWGNLIGRSVSTIATGNVTLIGFDGNGTQTENKTTDDLLTSFRTTIMLGVLIHTPTTIVAVNNIVLNGGALYSDVGVADLSAAMGSFNVRGNLISANGANLKLNKSAGVGFAYGIALRVNVRSPNVQATSALTAANFQYTYKNGSGGFSLGSVVSDVDPTKYDNGSGTPATVQNNKWSVQRIYYSLTNLVLHYGQAEYATYDDAVLGITTETFSPNPDAALGGIFLGYIILKQSATNLQDVTQAKIINNNLITGSAPV